MEKGTYLADHDVNDFVRWLADELAHPTLCHAYATARGQHFTFTGLPAALNQYDWSFRVQLPNAIRVSSGRTYADNEQMLDQLAAGLRRSLKNPGAVAPVINWSFAILKWGGVTAHNGKWLQLKQRSLRAVS